METERLYQVLPPCPPLPQDVASDKKMVIVRILEADLIVQLSQEAADV